MKKYWFFSLIAILVGGQNAQAELIIQPAMATPTVSAISITTPSDASIERLMTVLHVTDMIDAAIVEQNKIGQVIQTIPTQAEPKGIIARKKQQKLQEVLSKYGKVFGAELNNPERRQQMIAAYKLSAKKHYTQADVDALIGFYQTPMGQQLLQKQNQVALDYVQTIMPATVGKSADNLEQVFPMLEKDIRKIFE